MITPTKAQTDIDLCVTYDNFLRAGQNELCENIAFSSAKRFNKSNLFLVNLKETGIYVNYHTKYRNRYCSYDDSFHIIAKPYDNHRGKG